MDESEGADAAQLDAFTSRATLHEEIGQRSKAVQDQIAELSTFGKMVKLESFEPFK